MTNMKTLLNTLEAQSYLGISRTSLNKLRTSGRLPVVKLNRWNRYRREDLDAVVEKSLEGTDSKGLT
jgi:hypothetical protein